MTLEEALCILKKDRDLCLFNPTTGEREPMNEDCRQSAEAYDVILKELERRADNPAADVRENVKGEWIYNQTAKHDAYWQCSICGNKWADSIYFNVGTTNFCPHCGADMRGNYD